MNSIRAFLHRFVPSLARVCLPILFIAGLPFQLRAADAIVIGPGGGQMPIVHLSSFTGTDTFTYNAYQRRFTGGVRVALGDVNGDGILDMVTGPGPGTTAQVRIFNGQNAHRFRKRMGQLLPYGRIFQGGVFVAAGDVNGDGRADIVTGPDEGTMPSVRVFDIAMNSTIANFLAYDSSFLGGVRVAAGDVNGDGKADIVTAPGPGSGPRVKVFDGATGNRIYDFFAYDAMFTGGVYVAVGDINGDGIADIITGAGPGASPLVKVFDGTDLTPLQSFLAFDPMFTGGVRVAAGDVNGDNRADIIVGAGAGMAPQVKIFDSDGTRLLGSFFAYEQIFLGGVFVGCH